MHIKNHIGFMPMVTDVDIVLHNDTERNFKEFAEQIVKIATYETMLGHHYVKNLLVKWIGANRQKRIFRYSDEDFENGISNGRVQYVLFNLRSFVTFLVTEGKLGIVVNLCSLCDCDENCSLSLDLPVIHKLDDKILNVLTLCIYKISDMKSDVGKEYDKLLSGKFDDCAFKELVDIVTELMGGNKKSDNINTVSFVARRIIGTMAKVDVDRKRNIVKNDIKSIFGKRLYSSNGERYILQDNVVELFGLWYYKEIKNDDGDWVPELSLGISGKNDPETTEILFSGCDTPNCVKDYVVDKCEYRGKKKIDSNVKVL